jgi:hypothetical protein
MSMLCAPVRDEQIEALKTKTQVVDIFKGKWLGAVLTVQINTNSCDLWSHLNLGPCTGPDVGCFSFADPDPDPYVFGPPGSRSVIQIYGSGSFYHQAKILRKTSIPTVLWLDFIMTSLKTNVNVTSKSNKHKTNPGSGSVPKCQGSATLRCLIFRLIQYH